MDLAEMWGRIEVLFKQLGGSVKVDFSDFKKKVEDEGGVIPAVIQNFTTEDLQSFGLSIAVARTVIGIFKESTTSPRAAPRRRTKISAENARDEELVAEYDPDDPQSPVALRLAERSKGQPVLVFDQTGAYQPQATIKVLKEILAGDPPRSHIDFNGTLVGVWKVGTSPGNLIGLHPIDGTELRSDGTGVSDGLHWLGLSEEIRSILTIAIKETRELVADAISRLERVTLFNTCKSQGISAFTFIAPKAFVLFDERKKTGGGTPTLYVMRGRTSERKKE